MAQTIIDWLFLTTGVSNEDGAYVATVQGAIEVPGPGVTALGPRPTALRFGVGASCKVQLLPENVDASQFAVRVAFRVTAPVTTRGNLIESTALPLSIFVEPGVSPDHFNIAASIANGAVGWSGTNTYNRRALAVNQWYVISLVYDVDTLALLLDENVVAIAAYPNGELQASNGDQLYVGTWIDGIRWPFTGEIAGLQVWHGLPETLEEKLDAERGSAEWHLTHKENELRPRLNLGPRTADFYFDPSTASYIQPFAIAAISYTEAYGIAFVLYGVILSKWRADENLRHSLGSLASDEINGRLAGSRKSVFARGCIYWSPETGAVPVLERMYLDYELIGEGSSAIGLPVTEAQDITGGSVQHFQTGKMYLRNHASNAFEVHGAILAKYEAAGGPTRFGFPVTHESSVRRGTRTLGKVSEFERCTIYWSPRTPACIIYGDIRARYRGAALDGEGGPLGELGFPTSDESDIPGAPGARYNTFENGSILWFGGPIFVCRPFTVSLGRLDTKEEDRDVFDFDGQNDLYCRVYVAVNRGRVFDRKYPERQTHYPSANIRDLNINVPYTINPNSPDVNVRVGVEVWESDSGQAFAGGDDHLGTLSAELNMSNAWGFRSGTNGLFRASNFGPWVNYLDWSVRPRVTASTPLDFWGSSNRGTPTLDWREYAAAFSDVDPDFEIDFGIVDDGLKAFFYEVAVKGIASGGNCFGMSLEAIYAWKEQSRLGRPLSRYNNWEQVENDFNVKHAYQLGADAIWWFLGQFLSGSTHDPMNVFQSSWDAFTRGENPVICVAQNFDFSGAPHCILPFSWNRGSTRWEMGVFDPNFPNQRRLLTIDPRNNSFSYDGSTDGSRMYTGDAWSGGRFHYMPWSILNHQQRTPVWDAILLLLGGVVLMFGDRVEVRSLVDEKGNSLDASSARNRDALSGKLLQIPGLFGDGSIKGGLYVGKQNTGPILFNPKAVKTIKQLSETVLRARDGQVTRPGVLRGSMRKTPAVRLPVPSDAPRNAIAGATLMDIMRNNGLTFLRPNQPTDLDTIRCSLSGKANGKFDSYYKRGLLGVHIQSAILKNEKVNLGYERFTGRENEINIKSNHERTYEVTFAHKLGAGQDFLKITLGKLSVEANKLAALNVQPGMRAINILGTQAPTDVQVTVDGVVAGKQVKSSFNTQIQGGQRLILPELSDPSRLKVGKIDALLGIARDFKLINRQ